MSWTESGFLVASLEEMVAFDDERLNAKLHAVTDAKGRPLKFFMTAGQVSDYTGAAALRGSLPGAERRSPIGATTPTGSGMR